MNINLPTHLNVYIVMRLYFSSGEECNFCYCYCCSTDDDTRKRCKPSRYQNVWQSFFPGKRRCNLVINNFNCPFTPLTSFHSTTPKNPLKYAWHIELLFFFVLFLHRDWYTGTLTSHIYVMYASNNERIF